MPLQRASSPTIMTPLLGDPLRPLKPAAQTNSTHDDLPSAESPNFSESRNLKRALHSRHLSMLGIAGSIGTGLFLGLGSSIQTAGPLGALLAYATISLVVASVQLALGETSALLPVTGSFTRHAALLVDPSWSFAIGWNLVYGTLLSIPSEFTAICVLFRLWLPNTSPAVWITISTILTIAIGLAFIGVFGEIEYAFAILKILLVVFLIVFGLVISLGGIPHVPPTYFSHWRHPGPFVEYIAPGNLGRFLGYWSVMTNAVFSFAGVESLAMAAAETANPRVAIPRACRNVFVRIVLFYLLAVLVVGMLVASNDPNLNDDSTAGTVAQSPFVIAANKAGYAAVGSVVNAVVISSAWSSSNQGLLAGTRTLYGLALRGQAPRVFLRTTSWGVPIACVALYSLFMLLAFMALSANALTAFFWFVDLTAAGTLVSWISILLNHIRLLRAFHLQGISPSRLPWHNSWTVYSSYFGLIMCCIIILTGGFSVFTKGNWSASQFVSSYLDIPIVLGAFLLWKYHKKTNFVSLADIPLEKALELADAKDGPSDFSTIL